MRWFSNLTVKRKLTSVIMLVSTAALAIACTAFVVRELMVYPRNLEQQLNVLAEITADNATDSIAFGEDQEEAEAFLDRFRFEKQIVSACIYLRGDLWAKYPQEAADSEFPPIPEGQRLVYEGGFLHFSHPVAGIEDQSAVLVIKASLDEMYASLGQYGKIAFGVLVVSSIVALALSAWLRRPIAEPILALTQTAERVSKQNDYSARAQKQSNDEIGALIETFNGMLEQIQNRDEQLQKARDDADRANRAKSDFLSFMSHELRTPLTSIIGFSEFLLTDMKAEAAREEWSGDVHRIHASGQHLLELINDILDISKIEAGKMEITIEDFDIERVLHEAVSALEPMVKHKGNELKEAIEPGVGRMKADPIRVRQCLLNLLSNANKFTENGCITFSAKREVREGEDWVVFKVTDTGIGMSEAQVAKLFKAFQQADRSTSRKYGGTGLGLALTKHLCQLMGGDVGVTSREGEGSSFSIELPSNRETAAQDQAPSTDFTTTKVVGGEKGRVLAIDDDPAVHEMLKAALVSAGYAVESAINGREGLERAKVMRPDIIALDVLMPDMDGWTVLSLLKEDEELRDIPVIMISVRPDEEFGFSMGVADYIQKPINGERLVATLSRYHKMKSKRDVLIVEDDSGVREMLRRMLQQERWDIREAENGQQALERIEEQAPALIILDLLMPVMDGFQMVDELQKHPEWRQIPVVVISAKEVTPQDRDRLEGHVEKILQKGTFTKENLLAEVGGIAERFLASSAQQES